MTRAGALLLCACATAPRLTGPAARAGLESGDELVSVDGGADFDTPFRQSPGTRVRVVYRRGHTRGEITVTLARWRQ